MLEVCPDFIPASLLQGTGQIEELFRTPSLPHLGSQDKGEGSTQQGWPEGIWGSHHSLGQRLCETPVYPCPGIHIHTCTLSITQKLELKAAWAEKTRIHFSSCICQWLNLSIVPLFTRGKWMISAGEKEGRSKLCGLVKSHLLWDQHPQCWQVWRDLVCLNAHYPCAY